MRVSFDGSIGLDNDTSLEEFVDDLEEVLVDRASEQTQFDRPDTLDYYFTFESEGEVYDEHRTIR